MMVLIIMLALTPTIAHVRRPDTESRSKTNTKPPPLTLMLSLHDEKAVKALHTHYNYTLSAWDKRSRGSP